VRKIHDSNKEFALGTPSETNPKRKEEVIYATTRYEVKRIIEVEHGRLDA
jgi:hypothetical protein